MKQKKCVLSLVVIMLVFVGNFAVILQVSAASGLQMTLTTNPIIAAPGTNNYIELNLKSSGGTMSDIEITASSWDPKAVIPQGNWVVDVGTLENGESYNVIYEYSIPYATSPGLYQVVFTASCTGGSDIRQTAIIRVEDISVLDLESVTPTSMNIGEATTINFNLTNTGTSTINNILFSWQDSNDLILPVGSDNRITIASIEGNSYCVVPVVMMASSGISPGIYPLTITVTFYDQTGTQQTITTTVGMQISGTTTFDVVLQTSTGTTTTFAVVNTGANTASSVVVSIPQQTGFSTTGASSASLGNLEAGDYTLASFTVSSTSANMSLQMPGFNRTGTSDFPGGRSDMPSSMNFSGDRGMVMNRSFSGAGSGMLLVQIAYTDVFGIRQSVQKQVDLSSGSSNGFSSRTSTTTSDSGNFPRGFSGQTQASDSSNSIMYIVIGVVGIILIVAIIQLGRKKKLGRFTKFFKGRKE